MVGGWVAEERWVEWWVGVGWLPWLWAGSWGSQQATGPSPLTPTYALLPSAPRSPPPPQVPWDDLRYLMGEIMYGGHIVEDWDRRLAAAYLHKYFNDALLEGALLFPGFYPPPSTMPHPQARARVGGCADGTGGHCVLGLVACLHAGWPYPQSPTRPTHLPSPPPIMRSPTAGAGVHRGQHALRVGGGLWPAPQRRDRVQAARGRQLLRQPAEPAGGRRGGGRWNGEATAESGKRAAAVGCRCRLRAQTISSFLWLPAPRFSAPRSPPQPRDAADEASLSVEEQARQVLDSLAERIPEAFDLDDIRGRVDEFTPYVM